MRLDDVTVLDLSRLLPGPYGTQLLADMGAEVIKVEEPSTGDYARYSDPFVDGVGALFSAVNRGKKSVTVDLKAEEGTEVVLDLAEEVDVVFEQFRPGVAERLGVGYDAVKERNPDVVYVSLTGYGQEGPYSQRPGHDLNYVGFAGLLDMTRGSEDAAPEIPGYPIGDMSGGLFAAFATVSALLQRELTGEGDYVDVAMTDVVLSFSQAVSAQAAAGQQPRPGATELSGGLPCYDVYECSDGEYVTLAALEPKFWTAFCDELGLDEIADDHMAGEERREEVREIVSAKFKERPRDEWEEMLADTEVPVGPVKTPNEALEDEQIRERGIVEQDGPMPRVGFPALSASERASEETVPGMGEHNEEVLERAGYSESEIEALHEQGVL